MTCINEHCAGFDIQVLDQKITKGLVPHTYKAAYECPLCHLRSFKILKQAKMNPVDVNYYCEAPIEFTNDGANMACERCGAKPPHLFSYGIWILCERCKDTRIETNNLMAEKDGMRERIYD